MVEHSVINTSFCVCVWDQVTGTKGNPASIYKSIYSAPWELMFLSKLSDLLRTQWLPSQTEEYPVFNSPLEHQTDVPQFPAETPVDSGPLENREDEQNQVLLIQITIPHVGREIKNTHEVSFPLEYPLIRNFSLEEPL